MLRKLRLASVAVFGFSLGGFALHAQTTYMVPSQYASIQAAVGVAKSGDTILVAPGTYYGEIQLINKSLTLKSTGGASQTILDGLTLSVVLNITTNADVKTVVDGFTIQHGMSSSVPADGGVLLFGGGATLQNNIFINNHGYNVDAGNNSAVVMLNNTISTATTENGGCVPAAGLLLSGTLKDINNNVIVSDISGNKFTGDGTACSGPGIQISGVTSATVENNIITGTTLAMNIDATNSIVRQNVVYGNQSGALYLDVPYITSGGANVPSAGPPAAIVVNNTFFNNLSTSGTAEVVLDKLYAKIAMYNNLVVSNTATLPALSCVFTAPDSAANLTPPVLDHNDFADINPAANPGTAILGADCTPEAAIDGNVSVDPKFTSATNLLPQPGSPAIDAGDDSALNLTTTDILGNPRFYNTRGFPGTLIDLGAYESQVGGSVATTVQTVSLVSSSYAPTPPGSFTLTAQNAPTSTALKFVFNQADVPVVSTPAGINTASFSNLPSGLYRYTVTSENPDGTYVTTSPVVYVRVQTSPTTLVMTSSVNPSQVAQPVTFTITASAANGSIPSPVTLTDNGNLLQSLTPDPVTGIVTYTTSALTVGSHTIVASFAGTNNLGASSATVLQQVEDANTPTTTLTLTSSENPSDFNEPITFTATVVSTKGTPTGTITFTDQTLGTVLEVTPLIPVLKLNSTSGTATYTTAGGVTSLPPMAVGLHTIVATFTPSGDFGPSSDSLVQEVDAVTIPNIAITSSNNPSAIGDTVTYTIHLSAASGSVSVSDGNTPLGTFTVNSSGNATVNETLTTRGSHSITAIYGGASGSAPTSSSYLQNVNGYDTTTILTITPTPITPGTPLTLTAVVSPVLPYPTVPTGSVTFHVNNTLLYGTLLNGVATVKTATLPPGSYIFACTYDGDNTYNPSACAQQSTSTSSAATAIALTSSANPGPALSPVTFTALFTQGGVPTAGAAIVFTIGSYAPITSTTNAAGIATATMSLPVGSYNVVANFAATSTANASTKSLTEVVVTNPTSIGLVVSPTPAYQNTNVNLAATVVSTTSSAVPYGTVVILDGGNPIATLNIAAGQAAAAVNAVISTLAVGDHSLTATFTPADGNFLPSTSTPAQTLTILPQTFTVITSVPSITIETQHHATLNVTVNSIGEWKGFLHLDCSSLPAVLKCEFANPQLTLQPNGNATTQLTLETDAIDGFEATHGGLVGGALLLPLALLGFTRKRRRLNTALLLLFTLCLSTLYLTGCSGKIPDHTPPGTYQILVTATGAALGTNTPATQTATLTVVVTP